MTKWISVSECLPPENGKCLIYFQKRIAIMTFYNGHFYKSKAPKGCYDSWLTKDKRYKTVTHWAEIPNPPGNES